MAIHHRNGCRDLLLKALDITAKPMSQLVYAEFGNQRVKTDGSEDMRRMQSHASLMRWYGATYQSFDLNGLNTAAPVDLGKPIPQEYAEWFGRCDIVTNFGTSEHVSQGQRFVFHNAHDLCKQGGLMVHGVPKTGTCRRHGRWKYSIEWFRRLADIQGYKIHHLEDWDKSLGMPERLELGVQIYVMVIFEKPHSRRFRKVGWREPMRA